MSFMSFCILSITAISYSKHLETTTLFNSKGILQNVCMNIKRKYQQFFNVIPFYSDMNNLSQNIVYMFYLLKPILIPNSPYFTRLCTLNISPYFLDFAYVLYQHRVSYEHTKFRHILFE